MELALVRFGAKWLFAVFLCLGMGLSNLGKAQTFEEGYQSYMRNQFPVAELQFKSALKRAKNREDRAFILKFVGICQFMRGDKKSAATSFTDSLGMDRNVTIDEEEVLDPGVVSFFTVIKNRWLNSPEGMAANAQTKPAPSVAGAVPTKGQAGGALGNTQAKAPAQEVPVAKAPPPEAKATATAPLPTENRVKRKRAKESSGGNKEDGSRNFSVLHFMPFGLGQFHNESYLLGTIFALGQGYSLYQYSFLSSQITKEQSQNKQVSENPNILQSKKDEFLLANANYISGLRKDKDSAAATFAALWVGGVVQSLIFAPRNHSSEASGPETSKKQQIKSIKTGWLPNDQGGTYTVHLSLALD